MNKKQNKIIEFIKQIFIGPKNQNIPDGLYYEYYNAENKFLLSIWNDKNEESLGFGRIILILLMLFRYTSFSNFMNNIILIGRTKGTKFLWNDFYIIIKFILPLILINFDINLFIIKLLFLINIYFVYETIIMTLSIILHKNILLPPFSFKRTIIFTFINFLQIQFSFALIYKALDLIKNINNYCFNICNLQYIYFSFVSALTVGFGDFVPKNNFGFLVLIFQIVISFIYTLLFFSYFIAELINNKKNRKKISKFKKTEIGKK